MKKRLHVKKVTYHTLKMKWKIELPLTWIGRLMYIRCDAKGNVNWGVAPVYQVEELIERDNVKILTDEN